MTCYIAWYGKKRTRLAQIEREFISLLETCTDAPTLDKAAEVVRLAQIRALKEKCAKHAPSSQNTEIFDETEQSIKVWQSMATAEIISGYRGAGHNRKMSSAVRRH